VEFYSVPFPSSHSDSHETGNCYSPCGEVSGPTAVKGSGISVNSCHAGSVVEMRARVA